MSRTLLVLALALGAAGCGGETPVARVTLAEASGWQGETPAIELGYPEVVRLPLVWRIDEPLPDGERPLVFLHLVDGSGEVVRTFDHRFPEPWRRGATVADPVEIYQSALAPPLPAGSYRLVVGLYRPDGTRFPLDAGPETGQHEYEVARIDARAPSADLPRFELAGDWAPIEAGADRQVLASRWLAGEGRVIVTGAPGDGAAWMRLLVPSPAGADERLALGAGAAVQQLRAVSRCGGAESGATGPGEHEVELPVEVAPGAGAACEIELSPNFHVVVTRPGEEPPEVLRSVRLETLAWRATRPRPGGAR